MIPAGFIPPQYRRFEYAELTDAELKEVGQLTGTFDENMRPVPMSPEEIRRSCRKVVAVIDTRTGERHAVTPGAPPMVMASLGEWEEDEPEAPHDVFLNRIFLKGDKRDSQERKKKDR